MTTPEDLNAILNRIVKHQQTETDMAVLREWLSSSGQIVSRQQEKNIVNLGQGQDIQMGDGGTPTFGDRIYQNWDEQAIQALIDDNGQCSFKCFCSWTAKHCKNNCKTGLAKTTSG